jgi:hypothetical protein
MAVGVSLAYSNISTQEILKQMERISALVQNSTRDLTFDDEAFEQAESGSLAMALYNVRSSPFPFTNQPTH